MIDEVYLFWNDIHSCYMVMLCKKSSYRKTNITCSGNCDIIFFIKNRSIYDWFVILEQIYNFKIKCFSNSVKLIDGRSIIKTLDAADHTSMDPCHFRKLSLSDFLLFSFGDNCISHFLVRYFFHILSPNVIIYHIFILFLIFCFSEVRHE